jgi:hypothetical protein
MQAGFSQIYLLKNQVQEAIVSALTALLLLISIYNDFCVYFVPTTKAIG